MREQEFSPVKNAPGSASDSPDTARALLEQLHAAWLRDAGATIEGEGAVEVSPQASVFGEGLSALSGVALQTPALVQGKGEEAVAGDAGERVEVAAGVVKTSVT